MPVSKGELRGSTVKKTNARSGPTDYDWCYDLSDQHLREQVNSASSLTKAQLQEDPRYEELENHYREASSLQSLRVMISRVGVDYSLFRGAEEDYYAIYRSPAGNFDRREVVFELTYDELNQGARIYHFYVSDGAEYAAVVIEASGVDLKEIRIIDLRNLEVTLRISGLKFPEVSWLPCASSFLINRYSNDDPEKAYTIQNVDPKTGKVLHEYGSWSANDDTIPYTVRFPNSSVIFLKYQKGTSPKNGIAWRTINSQEYEEIQPAGKGLMHPIGTLERDGQTIAIFEDWTDTKFGRVVGFPLLKNLSERFEIVPEGDVGIVSSWVLNDSVYCHYSDGYQNFISSTCMNSREGKRVWSSSGDCVSLYCTNQDDGHLIMWNESLCMRNAAFIYCEDSETWEPLLGKAQEDTQKIFVDRVEAPSHDGVSIPMTVFHKGKVSGRPLLLSVYGGFGHNAEPYYSPLAEYWVDNIGSYAIAHVRGGGEFGTDWHDAGSGDNKINSFLDLYSCAKFLRAELKAEKLALHGYSHGGMLTCGAIASIPETFDVCVPSAAVTDMINFTRERIGCSWIDECGDPQTSSALDDLSPFHGLFSQSVVGTKYPAVLLTCGMEDDRVHPWHSLKFYFRLKDIQSIGVSPLLLTVPGGHNYEPSPDEYVENLALKTVFILQNIE